MYTNLGFSFKDIFNPKKNLTPVSKGKTSKVAGSVKGAVKKVGGLVSKGKGLFAKLTGRGGAEEAAPAGAPAAVAYAPEAAPSGGIPKWALPVGVGAAALFFVLRRKRG